MVKIDETELKRVVSAKTPRSPWRTNQVQPPPVSKNRRAAAKMIESVLIKAGLDVEKINEMLARDQSDVRGAFQKQIANTDWAGAAASYHQSVEAQSKAIGLLTRPFTIPLLDKPFAIWQLPRPEFNITFDSHIEPMNNWIKLYIEASTIADFFSDTQFVFYFPWENDSDSYALINVQSSLAPGGYCMATANSGIFTGGSSWLQTYAELDIMRWSGWGTDKATGLSNDQTPYPVFQSSQRQLIAHVNASGGYILQAPDQDTQPLLFQPFDLNANNVVIPPRAAVLFQVELTVQFGFGDGDEDISTSVYVDFNTGSNAVFCPFVGIEVLTYFDATNKTGPSRGSIHSPV
jgi:hypothetical protein